MELGEKRNGRAVGSASGRFAIRKEGTVQIVILGITGSGKSSLLSFLTKAKPKKLDQPFTTTEPVPEMMNFEDIQIQLIEAPAIFEGASAGDG
ncbi:MAG: hypothetical protein QG670_1510 [Thermoproteota archaeon]|nr:hypothetical protein [Thermoproteota archaeon]